MRTQRGVAPSANGSRAVGDVLKGGSWPPRQSVGVRPPATTRRSGVARRSGLAPPRSGVTQTLEREGNAIRIVRAGHEVRGGEHF